MGKLAHDINGTAAPKVVIREDEFVLHSYLLRIHHAKCSCCQSMETWSEAFTVYVHPRYIHHTGGRKLVPIRADRRSVNLPIEVVRLAPTTIPFCAACVDQQPTAIRPQATDKGWADALKASVRPTARPAAQPRPRIDISKLEL